MLNSIIGPDLTLSAFLICTAASLVLGIGLAFVSQFRARSTQSFAVTLAILPMVVQVVIMLVNGNIGAGVAVAGAFSLVRFRSAPGTAREIGVLFLGMAIGLATGMGYVGLAALTFVIVSTALLALTALLTAILLHLRPMLENLATARCANTVSRIVVAAVNDAVENGWM